MHTIPGVRVGPGLPAHHSNNAAGPLHAAPSWSNHSSSSSHAPHRRLLPAGTAHTAVHAALPKVGIVAVPEEALATARLPQQSAQQQPAPVQVRTSIRRSRLTQQHTDESQSSVGLRQHLTAVQHVTQQQQQQLWLAQAAAQQQPSTHGSSGSSRVGRQSPPRRSHASEQQLPLPLQLPQRQQYQPRQPQHINVSIAADPAYSSQPTANRGPTAFQQSHEEQQQYQQQRSNQQQQRQGQAAYQGRPQQQQPWHKSHHQQKQQWQGQDSRQSDWENSGPRQQPLKRPDQLQQTRPSHSTEDSIGAAAGSSDSTSSTNSSNLSPVFFSHGLQQDWSLPTGLAVTYLGSSSGAPTRDRNVSCTVLRLPEALYLVDCGEGSSRQMKLTGMQLEQIDTLFITHLHGDHCFGIGTMLVAMCKAHKAATAAAADHASSSSSSSSSSGYDSPSALRIVGPPRLGELVSTMLYIAGVGRQLDQPVYITEFVESESQAHDWQPLPLPASVSSSVQPVAAFIRRMAPTQQLDRHEWPHGLDRRLDRTGLRWQEMRRPSTHNWHAKTGLLWQIPCRQAVVTAAQLQHRVPCWGYVFDEIVQPSSSSSSSDSSSSSGDSNWRGRRVVLLGDTVDSRPIAPAALGADLVSHEATFAAGMENKACVAQHSTAWMAGQFAWAIKAQSLVLTHFSARYEGSQRDAAKATFGAAGGTGYVSEGEIEERAHQALKREADDQYGLGPVLLAIDLLSAHVRKPGEAEDASA